MPEIQADLRYNSVRLNDRETGRSTVNLPSDNLDGFAQFLPSIHRYVRKHDRWKRKLDADAVYAHPLQHTPIESAAYCSRKDEGNKTRSFLDVPMTSRLCLSKCIGQKYTNICRDNS